MLATGVTVGPYEILGLLGVGGMGEVYRARDPRLGRNVAIKVMPAELAQDAERLRRFTQEALAAGSLNHPSILVVFDTGLHEGAPYIVFELLEGQTLRDRLRAEPIPLRKTVDYAGQVAHALAAAHEREIVHRDLKPENLFLTREGRIKVLDFGLAKLRPVLDPGSGSVQTASVISQAGTVVGTVGYMSPEQVQGRPADPRSDIFSLGVVLYEMLSGRRAFQAETAAETMTAILREDPPDLTQGERPVPAALERITRRCLEKPKEERFQSARDVAFALEALSGSWGSDSVAFSAVPTRRRFMSHALVGAAILSAFGVGVLWRRGGGPPPVFQQLTFRRGLVRNARFAPDGSTIVYGARWGGDASAMFSIRAGRPESQALDLPPANILSISSAGEMAIVLEKNWTLARLPLGGGAPREIVEQVTGADWTPDGTELAVTRYFEGKSRLEFPRGKSLYETGALIHSPRVSPNGERVAFLEGVLVQMVDAKGVKVTLSKGWNEVSGLAWSPRGDEVWFSASEVGSNLAIHAVDLRGKVRLVARGAGSLELRDLASNGRALVLHSYPRWGLVVRPPGEIEERDLAWFDRSEFQDLAADGRTILFSERGEGGGPGGSVYVRATDGSPAVRLGEGVGWELSPDGKWVTSVLRGQVVLLPTGPGDARPLPTPGLVVYGAAFGPDGSVVVEGYEPGHAMREWRPDPDGGKASPLTPEGVTGHPVSPDGRHLPIVDPDGSLKIFPLDGGETRSVTRLEPGEYPIRWSADGRTLYVCNRNRTPASVHRIDVATGRKSLWREFRPADPAGFQGFTWISLTADEKAYAYGYRRTLVDLYLADGLE